MWPTASARDYKGAPKELIRPDGKHRLDQLDRVAERSFHLRPDLPTPDGPPSSNVSRSLNPLFVEWLMGWPIGWTLVGSTDSAPAATASSLWWQRMRGLLLMLASPPEPEQGTLL